VSCSGRDVERVVKWSVKPETVVCHSRPAPPNGASLGHARLTSLSLYDLSLLRES